MRGGTPKGIYSQIVAMNTGGQWSGEEALALDRVAVQASGKTRPWAVCIASASHDSPEVCDSFGALFGDELRCRTDFIRVFRGTQDGDDYARKIRRSEIVYLADGDGQALMDSLHRFGLEEEIRQAYERGVILCGDGAGAICWGKEIPNLNSKVGLGFLPLAIHLIKDELSSMALTNGTEARAHPHLFLSKGSAIHFESDSLRVVGKPGSNKSALVEIDGTVRTLSVNKDIVRFHGQGENVQAVTIRR